MKIGIDIDGVILDYERVLKTYGDLYDFIELKKDGIINRSEHYLRNRYDWTDEERMNFVNKYFLKLSKQTPLIPGAKVVIDMLQKEGNELIIISARGGMIEEMKDVALEKFKEEDISFNKYYWKQDDKLEVAKKEEIKIGKASIATVLSKEDIKYYDIEITKIDEYAKVKNISFKITDKELLDKTGGVVQGMSGSPIMQNRKIIGAVTHVIIDNPTTGYGLFITTMLEEGEK